MWREFILEHDPGAGFFVPATRTQLQQIEDRFQVILPASYINLMLETNGVLLSDKSPLFHNLFIVTEWNNHYRTLDIILSTHMPLDSLFFFKSIGNRGTAFGFPIVRKKAREDVFAWDPVTDSRVLVATSLKSFIAGWCRGELNVYPSTLTSPNE